VGCESASVELPHGPDFVTCVLSATCSSTGTALYCLVGWHLGPLHCLLQAELLPVGSVALPGPRFCGRSGM
jgi:hypothetical protein